MGEREKQLQQQAEQGGTSSSRRLGGMRSTVGEIVEVQGGHIVRSTGRKDRHSKVCTAKGPRDRRVRLSAHTAIQFYDVQDRLGFDRPSKAVDWLIKKAKGAIDELAQLPAWNPTVVATTTTTTTAAAATKVTTTTTQQPHRHTASSAKSPAAAAGSDVQNQMASSNTTSTNIIPPSLDSDVIADTIKSFFPMGGASAETPPASLPFLSYPPGLLSRTSSSTTSTQNQDLRLSLQSFQEQPMLLQHQPNQHQVLFSGTNPQYLGFDGCWSQQQTHSEELGRFQRLVAWNAAAAAADTGTDSGGSGIEGFVFNTPSSPPPPLFGQTQLISQRGPLQSSNTPSFRAWIEPAITADHHHQIPQIHHHHHHHQSAISGLGFTSSGGGFSGFQIPARIQGGEEEHGGIRHKPSSASSDSRH